MPAAIPPDPIRHQHLHLLASRRSPHPQAHAIEKEIDIVIAQPRPMKLAHRFIQIPCQLRHRLRAYRLSGEGRHHPTHLPRADSTQECLPDQQRDPPPPAAENVSAPPAENSSPGCARCAAEWCRTGSRNPARNSPCGKLCAGRAAVHSAPPRKNGPAAAPTAARKTAATLAGSAHTDRPRSSLSSLLENVGNVP